MGKQMPRDVEIKILEAQVKDSLIRGDAVDYFNVCDELGRTPEDPDLYERGMVEVVPLDIPENPTRKTTLPDSEELYVRAYWENVARTALPRFPENDRGEWIPVKWIKKRLKAIRETGYEVSPYSALSSKEAWGLLTRIKEDVYKQAGENCPELLDGINRRNVRQRRDAREIR